MKKFNLSKASNILRQVNSKLGGDLYTMKFPEAMNKRRTMLIGIDVSHEGAQSIVGFAASVNAEMTQYYSDYLVQKKGQEIVSTNMSALIEVALKTFEINHGGKTPTNLIIYRDGVGEQMRDQVLESELSQFNKVIKDIYNKAAKGPEITVVVVNKRVSQRFFVLNQGKLANPPSGCLIDKHLVEKYSSEK